MQIQLRAGFFTLLLLASCSEDKVDPVVPTLTTETVTDISQTVAISGGEILSDGGSSITDKGVVWGTSTGPTIAGDKESDGPGTGFITSVISGLTSNTTYYVRAYATNKVGTGYGNEVIFKTLKSPAHFIVTSQVAGATTFGTYQITVTVKNDGESTGYNVGVDINALNGSVIVDTGSAYPANLGNILPGQSAEDDAVFFDLTPAQAASLTFSTPVVTWLSRD